MLSLEWPRGRSIDRLSRNDGRSSKFMSYKKLGNVERFAVGDWRFFAGYCEHCKRKHFLKKDDAKFFVESVSIYCGARKNNLFSFLFSRIEIPKIRIVVEKREAMQEPEPLPLNIVRHRKKRVGEYNFDNRYKEKGGVQWLRNNVNLKLREIADHYGFSVNYAKRVKDGLT